MITTIDLANTMKAVKGDPFVTPYTVLRRLLIDSLAPLERWVWDDIVRMGIPVYSANIAHWRLISHQHASTILQRLTDYGLLTRTEVRTAHGRAWEYRVAE